MIPPASTPPTSQRLSIVEDVVSAFYLHLEVADEPGVLAQVARALADDGVSVKSVVSSRYPSGRRPLQWDERKEGIDVIRTTSGEELKLLSDGQQSPPEPGWTLMLTGGSAAAGYHWTLYGLPQGSKVPT